MTARHSLLWIGVAALTSACIPEVDLLFPQAIDGVPGVQHLGTIVPIDPVDVATVQANTIYGEVGPTGSPAFGGVSFDFVGTGRDICVFMDPELVSWSQSISLQGNSPNFSLPDNVFDDGDLDLTGGLSVYYSGVPGESIGDFNIEYVDSLGEVVEIPLVECFIPNENIGSLSSHAGRAMPEYCTVPNTLTGIQYTILMETYSTPIDDNRLSFGMVVTQGNCQDLFNAFASAPNSVQEECIITGESIMPDAPVGSRAVTDFGLDPELRLWVGDEVLAADNVSWPRSVEFETAFCNTQENALQAFCDEELRAVRRGDLTCSWEFEPGDENGERCYCGDITNTPRAGAF